MQRFSAFLEMQVTTQQESGRPYGVGLLMIGYDVGFFFGFFDEFFGVTNRGSWIVDRGSWIVDRGSWIVDRGSWIVDREKSSGLFIFFVIFRSIKGRIWSRSIHRRITTSAKECRLEHARSPPGRIWRNIWKNIWPVNFCCLHLLFRFFIPSRFLHWILIRFFLQRALWRSWFATRFEPCATHWRTTRSWAANSSPWQSSARITRSRCTMTNWFKIL